MVTDKIANLINGLKTASHAGKETAVFPYAKMSVAILELLKREDFISDFEVVGEGTRRNISVVLKYKNGEPAISNVKRISKPSRRVYKNIKDIRPVRSGYGLLAVTTPKGVMSGSDARKAKLGGEALFQVW